MRSITREIVAAIVISADKKIFFGKKGEGKAGVYSGTWHLPGGGVEPGEDPKDAIIREVKEELNLDVADREIVLIDDSDSDTTEKVLKEAGERVLCTMNFTIFKIELDSPASAIPITLNDEFDTYSWFSTSDLPNVDLTPPGRRLFNRINKTLTDTT